MLGLCILILVLRLDERSFKLNFKAERHATNDPRDSKRWSVGPRAQLVVARDISKEYKTGGKAKEEKVRYVNFTLKEKEIIGILGPSGAGKSSIFKMVTLAMSRTSGDLELLGKDFSDPRTPKSLTMGDISIVY